MRWGFVFFVSLLLACTASMASPFQSSRDEMIARIRAQTQGRLSQDRTSQFLKELREEIENPTEGELLRESTNALGNQLVRLYEEWERMTYHNTELDGELKPLWKSDELRKMLDENVVVYVLGLERLLEKRIFPSFFEVTERVKPSEALAKELLLRLIRDPNPLKRRLVLSLVGSQDYSESTRTSFSQIAAHLSQSDGDVDVQREALKTLGKLGVITDPEAKRKRLDALKQALGKAPLEDDTLMALSELGSEAQELVPEVRAFFVDRATPQTAAKALRFLWHADKSEASVELAQDYLLKEKNLPPSGIFEAYLLLEQSKKVPRDLSPEILRVIEEEKKLLQSWFDTALKKANHQAIIASLKAGALLIHQKNTDVLVAKACEMGSLDLLKLAIEEYRADVRAYNDFAFRWAAENGHLGLVKFLLERGADIHVEDDYALRWAAYQGRTEMVSFLISRGANVHADNEGALGLAAENGHLEVVRVLVAAGSDVHASENLALKKAAKMGHLTIVQFFLELKSATPEDIELALVIAAGSGHMPLVTWLSGKVVNDTTVTMSFLIAVEQGKLENVVFLSDKVRDVRVAENWALRTAVKKGYREITEFLFKKGASIEAVTDADLAVAQETKHEDLVQWVREKKIQARLRRLEERYLIP